MQRADQGESFKNGINKYLTERFVLTVSVSMKRHIRDHFDTIKSIRKKIFQAILECVFTIRRLLIGSIYEQHTLNA